MWFPHSKALASSGLKLGIISNWDDRLRPLLHRLRLLDYFETTIISHEVGFTKPSRVHFRPGSRKNSPPRPGPFSTWATAPARMSTGPWLPASKPACSIGTPRALPNLDNCRRWQSSLNESE